MMNSKPGEQHPMRKLIEASKERRDRETKNKQIAENAQSPLPPMPREAEAAHAHLEAPQPRNLNDRRYQQKSAGTNTGVGNNNNDEDTVHINAKLKQKYLKRIIQLPHRRKVQGARGGLGSKICEFVMDWEFLQDWLKVHASDLKSLIREINETERKYHLHYGTGGKEEEHARIAFAKKCQYLAYMANFKRLHWIIDRLLAYDFISATEYNDFYYYLDSRQIDEKEWFVKSGGEN